MVEILNTKEIANKLGCCTTTINQYLSRSEFEQYRVKTYWIRPFKYFYTQKMATRLKELLTRKRARGEV